MIGVSVITACGECCAGCEKKEKGACPGCIEADGVVPEWAQSGRCKIHACLFAPSTPEEKIYAALDKKLEKRRKRLQIKHIRHTGLLRQMNGQRIISLSQHVMRIRFV